MPKVFANVFFLRCFLLQEMRGILHFVQFLDLYLKYWACVYVYIRNYASYLT